MYEISDTPIPGIQLVSGVTNRALTESSITWSDWMSGVSDWVPVRLRLESFKMG